MKIKLKEFLSALRGEYRFHIVIWNGKDEDFELLCDYERFTVFTAEAFDESNFGDVLSNCRHFNGIVYSGVMHKYGDYSVYKFSFLCNDERYVDIMNILITPSAELVPELPKSLDEWFEQLNDYWNAYPRPKNDEIPF